MQHLILPDFTNIPVLSTAQLGEREFVITIALVPGLSLDACILYDADSGNNREGWPAQVRSLRVTQTDRMDIHVVLGTAPVAVYTLPRKPDDSRIS